MAITHRKGDYNDYDPSRMRPAEFGITLMNDPKAVDGRAVHIAFAAGEDKTLMTFEDAEGMIEDAAEEATAAATSQAQQYATNSQNSATESRSYAKGGTSSRSGEDTDNAMYYKNQAANSATAASNSAAAVSGSATTASNKASEAATSATNASGSATAAATSAGQAASSATAASGSATAAADSAEDAQEMSYTAEAWAVGTKNGIDVGSSDPQYHNNSKYYKEQAEAVAESIPEDYSELSDDVDQLKNALTTKAEQDGAYPDLTAGQLLSKNEASDSVPYNFRAVGQNATLEYTDAIVGGSVVRNQLVQASAWTVSQNANTRHDLYDNCLKNHVYLALAIQETTITSVTRNTFYYYEPSTDRYTFESSTENYSLQKGNRAWMVKAANDGKIVLWTNGASADVSYNNAMVIDLTAMFGTAIADFLYSLGGEVGVAWLRKRFPKLFTYQEYNAGEIVSVQGLSQHVTVGFNQWDEEWEVGGIDSSSGQNDSSRKGIRTKNYISVMPNTTYYCYVSGLTSSNCKTRWYDANKNYIGSSPAAYYGKTFATPSNAHYLRFCPQDTYGTTYNHDICINLSDPTRNGEYEPYQKRTYPLDSTKTFRGIFKLDSNNQLYADGDRYLPDGTVQRRYGVVDLGTVNWTYNSTDIRFVTNLPDISLAKNFIGILCQKYVTVSSETGYANMPDKSVKRATSSADVSIKDTTYTDAATFKTAMSGVYLVYELSTPTTETADPYTVPQIIDPDGTEEYVSTSIVPVGHESRYPLDIAGRLDRILTMPIANGTYTLRATVNNGAVTYAWVST